MQQRVAWNQNIRRTRLQNVFNSHTTQNAIAQRSLTSPPSITGVMVMPSRSAAIVFSNNQVLRNVDQTTSQITGVRCFQCGIRQTFTRTVSRSEVLEYVQTFTEVRGDWRFDDGISGFISDHAYRQLTNLCCRTTRCRSRPSCRCC